LGYLCVESVLYEFLFLCFSIEFHYEEGKIFSSGDHLLGNDQRLAGYEQDRILQGATVEQIVLSEGINGNHRRHHAAKMEEKMNVFNGTYLESFQ